MDTISRRRFLKLTTGAVAVGAAANFLTLDEIAEAALNQIPIESRVLKSADWLGVAEWSARTQSALRTSLDDPAQFALLALCSPEYIVSA